MYFSQNKLLHFNYQISHYRNISNAILKFLINNYKVIQENSFKKPASFRFIYYFLVSKKPEQSYLIRHYF